MMKFFNRPELTKVFTPSTVAVLNYVERPSIDEFLSSEMIIPGKQLIVYGHSGSGKTSSVRNMMRNKKLYSIRTHCEKNTTFEQLLLNAFDELNVYYVVEHGSSLQCSISASSQKEYSIIKSSISSMTKVEEKSVRLLPPQLTPQKLAKFLGEAGIIWIIEDFHKVKEEEKKRISDVIKMFVDNANDYAMSKIICIGACESAKELIDLEPNLRSRVSEISVPLLDDKELERIVRKGFELLNIKVQDSLVEKIVYYSDHLGACAHQMCLDICMGEKINKALFIPKKIEDDSFRYAVDGFVNRSSDTLKTIYECACKNELGWYILKTLSKNVSEKLSIEEISRIINQNHKQLYFSNEQIHAKLVEFTEPALSIIRYHSSSERYSLASPFWHRFLRMQFEIEATNKSNKKKNKGNRNLMISQTERDHLVDEVMLQLWKDIKETKL